MIYYVNKNAQRNGDHEVHRQDCSYLPEQKNRQFLGDFILSNDRFPERMNTQPTIMLKAQKLLGSFNGYGDAF